MSENLNEARLLGIKITSEEEEKVLEYITKRLEIKREKLAIFTPNPEMLVYAKSHPSFKRILNSSSISLPDGIGLIFGAKVLAVPLRARITGVDMMERICKRFSKGAVRVGLLGGENGVAEKTAECLIKKYPGLNVVFAASEWPENFEDRTFKNPSSTFCHRSSSIDFLFVAFGFPKQEEWIYRNLNKLPVTAAMGVGGAFDYISGSIVRAPKVISTLGLEWLFRLVLQPWRIKRQAALVTFLWLILLEWLRKRV